MKKDVTFLKPTVLSNIHKTVIIFSGLRIQIYSQLCGLCQHDGAQQGMIIYDQGWSAVLHRWHLLETVYIWYKKLGSDVCSKPGRWPCPISKRAGQRVRSSLWNKVSWQWFRWPDRYRWEGVLLDFKSGQSQRIDKGFQLLPQVSQWTL